MADEVEKHPVKWYRSTLFAAFMVAATSFTCPGIFSSLNGMGAGGGASPDISNAANAIVFGTLAVGSILVGAICNRISPKWCLFIGTLGYSPYAAGLYVVDRSHVSWFLLFAAVIIGISACFLWVASGAVFMGYTEENRKGFAASLKFSFQALGGAVGGIISLALNVQRDWRGSISRSTYITFITIIGLGFPFALLLPTTSQLQRTDGRKVVIKKAPTLLGELKSLWRIVRTPTVLALLPLVIYSQWFLSYQWQFNYAYFTVRARALNSALFYLTGLFGALVFGQVLDLERFPRRTRAKIGFFVILLTNGLGWILGQAVQVHYSKTLPTIDWDDHSYGLGCFLFTWWGFSDPLTTTYLYWVAGSLTNRLEELTLVSSLINSVASLGSTFGFVVSAVDFNYNGACALNLALFWLAIPGLAWVVFTRVRDTSGDRSLLAAAWDEETLSGSDETAERQETAFTEKA